MDLDLLRKIVATVAIVALVVMAVRHKEPPNASL